MRTLGVVLALASALALSSGAIAAGKFPKSADIKVRNLTEKDFPRWQQIVPNVYAYEDTHSPDPSGGVVNTVSLIVVTPDGTVLVDGQGDSMDGTRLVNSIKKITPQPLKYVIIGSDHIDHVGGNAELQAAWPQAVFISSPTSQKTMQTMKRTGIATELVSDKRTINMGGTEIQVLNLGRAHTGGDLAVYLPATKVLFLGEIYLRDVFPAMRSAYPTEWIATLKKAEAMNADWIIPGHGFIDTKEELKADLVESRKALEAVIAEVNRLHKTGAKCESPQNCEAAKQANFGPYKDWALSGSQIALAVAKVYQEIEGKLPK
jgi:glyoxylase-like metal-dependent hydrolase (beta-lactamase superfamily II)